jgi:transposase-like protein
LIFLMLLSIVDPQLTRLVDRAGEDGHRVYLESLRWPDGAVCPRCDSSRLHWIETRSKYHCCDCRYQFRVTAGTVFHGSHISLRSWFKALALILSSERGYPATELHKALGGSYKTAWFVEHRIRAALGGGSARVRPPLGLAVGDGPAPAAGSSFAEPPAPAQAPPTLVVFTRLVAGTYRHASLKYLSAYWNEARWRTEQRENPDAFRDTVLELLRHPPLTYEQLVASGPSG